MKQKDCRQHRLTHGLQLTCLRFRHIFRSRQHPDAGSCTPAFRGRRLLPILSAVLAACLFLAACGSGQTAVETTPAATTTTSSAPAATAADFNHSDSGNQPDSPTAPLSPIKTRFDDTVAYLEGHADLSGYTRQTVRGLPYETDSDFSYFKSTWQNNSYPGLTEELAATVCGYRVVLGKTTYQELLDQGFVYVKGYGSDSAPYHASFKKDGQCFSCIGDSAAADRESSVVSYLFLYGPDFSMIDNLRAAEFEFHGLKLDDDLSRALSVFPSPDSIEVYSSEKGAHSAIHLIYPVSDRSLRISFWYDDANGSFLDSIEMRYDKL